MELYSMYVICFNITNATKLFNIINLVVEIHYSIL